jgi:hypothetical protein
MLSVEQEIAIAAARRRFIIHVVHSDGGQYMPDCEDLRALLRDFADEPRANNIYGSRLIARVEERACAEREVDAALRTLAQSLARQDYEHWLDCGHGPSVSSTGPVVAIFSDEQRRECRECAAARERTAMRETDTFTAHLNEDAQVIETAIGGVLARVTRCWKGGNAIAQTFGRNSNRIYWRAVDDEGHHWYGHIRRQSGTITTMHRKKMPTAAAAAA